MGMDVWGWGRNGHWAELSQEMFKGCENVKNKLNLGNGCIAINMPTSIKQHTYYNRLIL